MSSRTSRAAISPTEYDFQESPSIPGKRKHSTDEPDTGRVIKHRSSQACHSCRIRKVRCDVVANGSSCTNCRLDQVECVVLPSRRGKTNHAHRQSSTSAKPSVPLLQSINVSDESTADLATDSTCTVYETIYTPTIPDGVGHVPLSVTFDEELDKSRNEQHPTESDTTRNDGIERVISEPYNETVTPELRGNLVNQYQTSAAEPSLPAFIAPLSKKRIGMEDLKFLAQKGAMTVPSPALRGEILRAYLFSVHPFMPMLDLRGFVHAVFQNQAKERLSLLLFQAVMFAGLHSLSLDVIRRLGFNSVKQARKVFFDRVRLLYDFDVEMDSAAVLQSLVLMSLWYGKWDDRRHTWHWTGLAYDAARNMGLHREPTATRYPSEKVRRFRRKLWWSLYIRDRMIALGTRRPMRIRDDEFNVAMLTLEDFDLFDATEYWKNAVQKRPPLPSTEESGTNALICIELAKLCICIGRVVSSQYTVLAPPEVPYTMMVVSRDNAAHTEALESCDKELNEWFDTLATKVQRNSSPATHHDPGSCSEIHWEILNITYLTLVNVLHRAQALRAPPETSQAQQVQRSSRTKVKEAARSLTKLSQNMLQHDQVRYMGPIGVTALMAACLSHMLDASSADEDVRDASVLRLYQSLQVLQALQGSYASADAAVSFLGSVMRKNGIHFPFQDAPADFVDTSKKDLLRNSSGTKQPKPGERSTESFDRGGVYFVQTEAAGDDHPPQAPLSTRGAIQTTNRKRQSTADQNNASPSAVTFAHATDTEFTSGQRQGDLIGDSARSAESTGLAELSHLTANDGIFLDYWTDGMDSATGNIDLEAMAFNYDFYSDAFGFSLN